VAYFDLFVQTGAGLGPPRQPSDFVYRYWAVLHCRRDLEARARVIGQLLAYRVRAGLAARHGISPAAVWNTQSPYLRDCYGAISPALVGSLDCLALYYTVLDPRWRGLGLGPQAVRRMVDLLGDDCDLAVSHVAPLRHDAYTLLKVPPWWLPQHQTPGEYELAIQKLRRCIEGIGFEQVGRTRYYRLSLAHEASTTSLTQSVAGNSEASASGWFTPVCDDLSDLSFIL
jgi:hypothetical protein